MNDKRYFIVFAAGIETNGYLYFKEEQIITEGEYPSGIAIRRSLGGRYSPISIIELSEKDYNDYISWK